MVEAYQRRSALAHLGLALRIKPVDHPGISLREGQRRTILNIRGKGNDFADAVWRVAHLSLPKANHVQIEGERQVIWLGPDEYWLTGPEEERESMLDQLKQVFANLHAAVTDLSESRTSLYLSGSKARDVLARGMSIDLHPSVFSQGQCAQTSLARANILLQQLDEAPTYAIYVLNSFADYLWRWLERTAEPFGCQIAL